MTRRELFIKTGGGAGLALFAATAVAGETTGLLEPLQPKFRLVPIPGQIYSDSFLRHMRNSRFPTAAQAVSSIHNRRVRVAVQRIQ